MRLNGWKLYCFLFIFVSNIKQKIYRKFEIKATEEKQLNCAVPKNTEMRFRRATTDFIFEIFSLHSISSSNLHIYLEPCSCNCLSSSWIGVNLRTNKKNMKYLQMSFWLLCREVCPPEVPVKTHSAFLELQ